MTWHIHEFDGTEKSISIKAFTLISAICFEVMVIMSFGLPYKGSKSIYAKQICEALPSGKRLVDLFAGGCAITDCAIRKYPNKWGTFLVNDINPEPLDLYAKCLCGNNPVSYEWVSREDFKSKDWATRLVWSFGNNCLDYL